MPLLDFDRELYVKRSRHYVDNEERTSDSKTPFDIVTDLNKQIDNIESIEVVNHNIPLSLNPSFIPKTSTTRGNNLLDIRLEDVGGGNRIEFTVEINAPYVIESFSDFSTYMSTLISDTMDAQGDPMWSTTAPLPDTITKVEFTYGTSNAPNYIFTSLAIERFFTNQTVQGQYLFGSGPNKGNGPERVFGFPECVDTNIYASGALPGGGPGQEYLPVSYKNAIPRPFQYVDIFVDEMEPNLLSGTPLSRVFISETDFFLFSGELPWRPRLMTTPLRIRRDLRVKLLLEDDIAPLPSYAYDGWDVTLDILSLSDEVSVPQWIQTRFQFT